MSGPNGRERDLRFLVLIALVGIAGVSCTGDKKTAETEMRCPPTPSKVSPEEPRDPRTLIRSSDDHLADVTKVVPAFAGYWNEGPRVVIAVTDGSSESARRSMSEVRKRVHRDIGYGTPIVVSARYSFGQLKSWYEAMTAEGVFSIPGMVSGGIKETKNVVHLGFEDPNAASKCIQAVIDRAGVPADAYEVKQEAPLQHGAEILR